MPQLIQRSPTGLLSVTDSKAGGSQPNTLLDEVRPVLELVKLYGLGVRDRIQGSIAAASVVLGNNTASSVTVPAGEVWHVLNITGIVNNVVAAGITWAPGYGRTNTTAFSAVVPEIATATGVRGMTGSDTDLWLGPGEFVGTYVTRTTAGADLIWHVAFDRFRL